MGDLFFPHSDLFPMNPEKRHSFLYLQCFYQRSFLKFSEKSFKFNIHYSYLRSRLTWTLLPNLTFYLIMRGVHRSFATDAACQQRTCTPSGHLVLSHTGTCMCSHVETNLSWTCLVSRLLSFEHPSVLLFRFHVNHCASDFANWRSTLWMCSSGIESNNFRMVQWRKYHTILNITNMNYIV